MHTYMHTYIHTYIHIYIHTYIHTYIRTYIHTYVRMYVYVHVRTRMYIHTYTYCKQKIGGTKIWHIWPNFICQLQKSFYYLCILVSLDEPAKLSSVKHIYWQICQTLVPLISKFYIYLIYIQV